MLQIMQPDSPYQQSPKDVVRACLQITIGRMGEEHKKSVFS